MKPVLIYISSLEGSDWDHRVFRNAKTLRDTWNDEIADKPWELCIIHLGYKRPDYDRQQIRNLPEIPHKPVLLTESAKWGLPAPHSICSRRPIGSCQVTGKEQACNLYLALDSWGYQILEEALENHSPTGMAETERGNWVTEFLNEKPNFETNLEIAGIYDESSYLKNKNELDEDSLKAAGNFRFLFCKKENEQDPFEILAVCPDWLLNCTLNRINLTAKLLDVFERENIIFVEDIQNYRAEDLNLDRKSLRDLAEALLSLFAEYRYDTDTLVDGIGDVSLDTHLEETFSRLPLNAWKVIRARLGADEENPQTLQSIADILGITRERVRQIEKKYLKSIIEEEEWDDMIYEKIEALLSSRKEPLYVDMLSFEDEWFKGFDGKEGYLKAIITRFSEQKVKVFKFIGRDIISSIDQNEFDTLIRRIKSSISSHIKSIWTKEQAKNLVETECLGHGVSALKEIIWSSISEDLHFATRPNGEEILVGMGKSVDNFVSVVLEEAEKPLYYPKIHERVCKISNREVDIHRTHGSLGGNPEAKLFNRGIYGLRRHLDIDEETTSRIVGKIEEVINDGDTQRQWHASELLQTLFEEDKNLRDRLNPYTLRILLEDSENLIFLGRQVWASKRHELYNSDRIQLRDALISILEEAGHPLTTKELLDRVSKYRGVKSNAQIHPSEPLIRIAPSTWGLSYRDLPASED